MPTAPKQHASSAQPKRGTTNERHYGAEHRRLRVLCFERDRFRCVDCGWEPEIVTLFRDGQMGFPPADRILDDLKTAYHRGERHLHADHHLPLDRRPDLARNLDNLRTRCDRCHDVKSKRERNSA